MVVKARWDFAKKESFALGSACRSFIFSLVLGLNFVMKLQNVTAKG